MHEQKMVGWYQVDVFKFGGMRDNQRIFKDFSMGM